MTAKDLVDARLQLHHAAQLVSSLGLTFLEAAPDDSHPNLGWNPDAGALVGRALPGNVRGALRLADMHLLVLDSTGDASAQHALDGSTIEAAYAWLADVFRELGLAVPVPGLSRPAYELPDHAVAKGRAFSADPARSEELASWFARAHETLTRYAETTAGASDVRCWPHHFDIATLVPLGADKTLGLGMSPGDGSYAEPYFYVSPWPYPAMDAANLPDLPTGHWHTDGFVAAIATRSELEAASPTVEDFVRAADTAGRELLLLER